MSGRGVGRGQDEGPPRDEPQGNPQVRDLHATTDIRFVMVEVAKLDERIKMLTEQMSRSAENIDKSLTKHAIDVKERTDEIRGDLKAAVQDIGEIEKKVSFVKGAMWVLGGLFAIAVVVGGILLRYALQ